MIMITITMMMLKCYYCYLSDQMLIKEAEGLTAVDSLVKRGTGRRENKEGKKHADVP